MCGRGGILFLCTGGMKALWLTSWLPSSTPRSGWSHNKQTSLKCATTKHTRTNDIKISCIHTWKTVWASSFGSLGYGMMCLLGLTGKHSTGSSTMYGMWETFLTGNRSNIWKEKVYFEAVTRQMFFYTDLTIGELSLSQPGLHLHVVTFTWSWLFPFSNCMKVNWLKESRCILVLWLQQLPSLHPEFSPAPWWGRSGPRRSRRTASRAEPPPAGWPPLPGPPRTERTPGTPGTEESTFRVPPLFLAALQRYD